MDNQDLPRISLKSGRELPFANLQLGADLVKAMCAIKVLGQSPIINFIFIVVELVWDTARSKAAATPTPQ